MTDGGGFEVSRTDDVLRVERPGAAWLSTGWNGGRWECDAAYNLSVPEGWTCDEIGEYVDDRLESAGFADAGPALLTGVDLEHARAARCGSVTVCATAGLSNPAALPVDPSGGELPDGGFESEAGGGTERADVGTVNLVVGTTRALADGALANLCCVASEAKAATLVAKTGFPGTTTDAVIVGHDPSGPGSEFSGSATPVGAATRACVRDAVLSSLRSRYRGRTLPESIAAATYGVSTDVRADVFRPGRRG